MMKESITTTLEPVPVFLQIYLLFGILGVILILVRGIISSYKNVKRTGSFIGRVPEGRIALPVIQEGDDNAGTQEKSTFYLGAARDLERQ